MNVYPFIEAEKVRQRNVRRACLLLSVSRAAYYAWSASGPDERRRSDDELLVAIKDAHKASRGTYGSPRITRDLRKRGLRVSRKRVARLMRQRGIVGRARRRRKRTTIADPAAAKTADLLKRNFTPAAHELDKVWCGDISYVRTWEGWAYVATVIDLATSGENKRERVMAAMARLDEIDSGEQGSLPARPMKAAEKGTPHTDG